MINFAFTLAFLPLHLLHVKVKMCVFVFFLISYILKSVFLLFLIVRGCEKQPKSCAHVFLWHHYNPTEVITPTLWHFFILPSHQQFKPVR